MPTVPGADSSVSPCSGSYHGAADLPVLGRGGYLGRHVPSTHYTAISHLACLSGPIGLIAYTHTHRHIHTHTPLPALGRRWAVSDLTAPSAGGSLELFKKKAWSFPTPSPGARGSSCSTFYVRPRHGHLMAWYNTAPRLPSGLALEPTMSHTSPTRHSRAGSDRSGQDLTTENMMGHESDSPTPSGSRPGPSGRKGSKKVRTGCITCK